MRRNITLLDNAQQNIYKKLTYTILYLREKSVMITANLVVKSCNFVAWLMLAIRKMCYNLYADRYFCSEYLGPIEHY